MPNTIAQNLQRLIDAKIAIANAITAKGGTVGESDGLEDFASDIESIPSGGGSSTILHGSTQPTSSIGNDGDVYFQTDNLVADSVIFTKPVVLQLDYYCNENSVIEFECALPAPTNSYDTPWGSRGGSDYFIAYNGGTLRYDWGGVAANIGSITAYYDQRLKITLSRIHVKVETSDGTVLYDIDINGGTTASTVKLGLFTLFTDNSGSDFGECRSNGSFYGMKIYENDVLLHDYEPYQIGGIYCVRDMITGNVFNPLNGPLSGTTTPSAVDYIQKGFAKVNGEWQNIIGTPIDDITT